MATPGDAIASLAEVVEITDTHSTSPASQPPAEALGHPRFLLEEAFLKFSDDQDWKSLNKRQNPFTYECSQSSTMPAFNSGLI